jgi:hypothetical protein
MKNVKLTRRQFSAGVAAAGSTAPGQVTAQAQLRPGAPVGGQPPGKRPNVVVIMCDDIGWGDPNAYGFDRSVRTPNLNRRLAAEGVRFTNWYGQSSCTGRASFHHRADPGSIRAIGGRRPRRPQPSARERSNNR